MEMLVRLSAPKRAVHFILQNNKYRLTTKKCLDSRFEKLFDFGIFANVYTKRSWE